MTVSSLNFKEYIVDYGEVGKKVLEAINKVNPMGLMEPDLCPDEFVLEAAGICKLITDPEKTTELAPGLNREKVAHAVAVVFSQYFWLGFPLEGLDQKIPEALGF